MRRRRTRSISRRGRTRRHPRRKSQKGGGEPTSDTPFAVIIEPRNHKALAFVLRNFHEHLPPAWKILVLHSTENETFVRDTIVGISAPPTRFQMRSLGVPSMSYEDYNTLLKQPEFYEKYIPAETFLLFQTDSMICGPHKDLLQKFLAYDYVGAPWREGGVGNGGLSLRKRSAVVAKLRACPVTGEINEDKYFASDCDAVKLKRPTDAEAQEFSIEAVYAPKSFGVHKAWAHLMPHEMTLLETQCPSVKELQALQ